jgi:hypothetical protein
VSTGAGSNPFPSEGEGEVTPPPRLDTSTAHSARVWNYLLGGKDNFAADREAGDLILAMFPGIAHIARVQRRFLARAVRYLAGQAGLRQFPDLGTGLPTAENTHRIAQRIAPQSRVVYMDNDPLVLIHARALPARGQPLPPAQPGADRPLLRRPDPDPPGVVTTSRWRPEITDTRTEPREIDAICGVGRKG